MSKIFCMLVFVFSLGGASMAHAAEQILAYDELTSAGASLSASFEAKDFLRFVIFTAEVGAIGSADLLIRFNGDTANNYAYAWSVNGGSPTTGTAQSSAEVGSVASNQRFFGNFNGVNRTTQRKTFTSTGAMSQSAAVVPNAFLTAFVWANESTQITSMEVFFSGSVDLPAGSYLIVYGNDVDEDTSGGGGGTATSTIDMAGVVNSINDAHRSGLVAFAIWIFFIALFLMVWLIRKH